MTDVAETIEESAHRIGHNAWVEARLFEIVGSWAGTVTEPRSRALFGRQSAHHGWHVELWHGLLPALPHVADTQLVAPGGSDAETVATLAELDERPNTVDTANPTGSGDGPEVTDVREASGGRGGETPTDAVDRLIALYRQVLPALLATYDDHLAHTSPIADGPTMRVLQLVRTDLTEDIAAGEALIEALVPAPNPSV